MATPPKPRPVDEQAAIRSARSKKAAATRKANARRPGAPPLRPVPPEPPARPDEDEGAPAGPIVAEILGDTPPAEPSPAARVWEEVRGAADEVSDRRTGPPTIVELNRAFGRLASTGTLAAASYFAETDPRLRTDAEIDNVVSALALSEAEAAQITYPVARFLGRSSLNKRAGRMIVENVEVGESASVILTVALRWRRYLRDRSEELGRRRAAAIDVPYTTAGRPPAPQPNPFDAQAPPVDPTANGAGVLATPEMVDRIRSQGGF